jgi:hypothetical protein
MKCYHIHRGKPVWDWFFGKGETVVAVESFYDQVLAWRDGRTVKDI